MKNTDNSPKVSQRNKLKEELRIRDYVFNEKQLDFIKIALNKDTKLIICDAPAGTAKTFLSVYCALKLMSERRVSDLIYLRSTIQAKDGETGFLKGDLAEKMHPFLAPLEDKLVEFLPQEQIRMLYNDSRIHGIPTSLLRGHSFNAKAIIADEMQNASFDTLLTVATRHGEFSKTFIIGDSQQNDLNGKSGFKNFIKIFDDEESRLNGIHVIKFTSEDIVRSGLVKFIIKKIEDYRTEPMFPKK